MTIEYSERIVIWGCAVINHVVGHVRGNAMCEASTRQTLIYIQRNQALHGALSAHIGREPLRTSPEEAPSRHTYCINRVTHSLTH